MRWSSGKPSIPGFYWNRGPGGRKRTFELRDEGRGLYIVQTGKALLDVGESEYEWAGPIKEPEK